MTFAYSRRNLSGRQAALQRALEILPGLTSWMILVGMTILSISWPLTAAILIIAFDFYWFLRLIYMTIFLVLSYARLIIESRTPWVERVHAVDALIKNGRPPSLGNGGPKRFISRHFYRKDLKTLRTTGDLPALSRDIFHVVIIPVSKEPRGIYESGIRSLASQDFPPKQLIVVLAVEERATEQVRKDTQAVANQYREEFFDMMMVLHPDGIPGEARVKGANVTCAARRVTEYLRDKKIPLENVLVSCFDADTIVPPNYFACLTYHFMVTPRRTQASFQPIPVYHNNIWDVPGFARVMESGSSFFQLIEATNPERLVTFSSHSMSFKALVDVGYWPVDMISDDSAIFWKAYIHFNGHYKAVPMYITLSMDVVAAANWWKTARGIYKQKRRWAWGVENFPIVLRAFLQAREIPLVNRIKHSVKLFEGHVSWATWGFLLSFIGWLPIIFGRGEFAKSVMYYNAPQVAGTIFNLATLSLLISIVLSVLLMPKSKRKYSWKMKLIHSLEWLSVPIILVFLNALPALDAQTRMMMGRPMEFWVADKRRKQETQTP
ncbi:MAG: glycosyltransferase family 2 protein [Candidatus Omnitrophota bacterium]|nr:glycosyltransferase family 2 protein [Candidatus Omnitrophota bacterium]MDZ4243445.1 glycosyltransferase family 2 protein [Candidatus Omnitrophota bacterium]